MRPTNRVRPIVAVALTLALAFTAGCSSDKKGDAADKNSSAPVSATDKKFCEAARAAQSMPTSQRLEGAEKQAAVAPKEIKAQFSRFIEVLKFADADPNQQAEINARMTAVVKDITDIASYSSKHCGITFDFGS